MQRTDPFEALEPYARRRLRQAIAGRDISAIAQPRYNGLVRALQRVLSQADADGAGAEALRVTLLRQAPDLAPHVTLLDICAARLIDILSGDVAASEVMFPGGSMELVEPIYCGNRWTDHFNKLTATAVSSAVVARRAQDSEAVVRLLEVGAGTGGTSSAVLAALEPHKAYVVYDYTDVSPGFVQHGKRVHGVGRPFFVGRLLDLEKLPEPQGFEPGSYDIVLGTNVLHATSRIATSLKHINSLLAQGGLLLLNELTRAGAFAAMTFGLLDGWWAFCDAERRLPDAPLLSPSGWQQELTIAGFNAPAVFGWTEPTETSFQCLFIAAKQGEAATVASPVLRDLRPILTLRLAGLLGLESHELAVDRPLSDFGVDSIVAPQFVALLNKELGSQLVPTDIFNCVTIAGLVVHLSRMLQAPETVVPPPLEAMPEVISYDSDIAVIGLACRFPGAGDAETFWQNLIAGRSAITEVPSSRWDAKAEGKARWGGFLDDHDCFDPEFFNLSWREAEAMSPQQRVFLEQAWNALEDAGYGKRSLVGRRCGVFVGAAPDGYGVYQNDSLSSLGGSLAILAARISYLLDLKGPSLPIDTACSSSLVAVHLACQSLLAGDCDMALAGGVSVLMTDPRLHDFLDDAGMLSPTGQCHTFDAAADGFVPGEGVAVVVLKRLSLAVADGDVIVGVIKASCINQDGRTSGITAPSGPAQTALELAVYEKAGIDPAAIGLVEAHGTGTQLGDPIEVNALAAAFRRSTAAQGFCALGSVKTNIGHTLTAAGIAGLIKALLALRHKTIPPTLHFSTENPEIDFARSPFFVPREATPWSLAPRYAAVSSFGFSGTNAHMLVVEAPALGPRPEAEDGPVLILLSGRSAQALEARRAGLLAWLTDKAPRLTDLAYTLSHGRGHFEHRLAIIVDSIAALRAGGGQTWKSAPLVLPAKGDEDAELAALLAADKPDLARIADCYNRGGDADWSRFAPAGARRLSLPGYRFARQRFAVRSLPKPAEPQIIASPVHGGHPMLAGNVSDFNGMAFRLNLDAGLPWLRDHCFRGSEVLPAVAFIEMACAAAALARGAAVTQLSGLRFDRPLLAETDSQARLTLTPEGSNADFEVRSAAGALHAAGRVEFGPLAAVAATDLVALAERLPNIFAQAEIYERFQSLGFAYGPSFRVLRSLRADREEVLAELVPTGPSDPTMLLSPALLDGAVQASIGVMLAGGEAFTSVVPVGFGTIVIHGPVAGACFAHVKLVRTEAADMRRLEIAVLDPAGRPLVTLHDVTLRVALTPPQRDRVLAFAPAWQAESLAAASAPATLLVFDRDEALWRSLGNCAILVRPGSGFCRLEARYFAIDPANAEDYRRLCDTLRAEGVLPDTVWHLWSRAGAMTGLQGMATDAVAATLRDGLQSVFHLSGALARGTPTTPLVILHVHADVSSGSALHSPIAGFGAALARENPLMRVASIAVEYCDSTQLGTRLAAETAAMRGARSQLQGWAARWDSAGSRFVRRLRAVAMPVVEGLRRGGVFLLTGALGGIGRHVARHLAAKWQARLVLVGRSPAGAASEVLIAEIKQAGGDAVYQATDIADEIQVTAAVSLARRRFGGLNGVIHAAGVTRDRFLLHKNAEDLAAVLAPKIAGTLMLDRVTAGEDLDLFLCFSSLAGTFGNAGQTDYSAANRFLDDFAAVREGRGRTLSIGWPYWRDGGIVVDAAEQDRRAAATGIRSLNTEEGLAVFDALAGQASGSVLVLPGDASAIGALIDGPADIVAPVATDVPAVGTAPVEAAVHYLRGLLARATAMPEARINPDKPLEQYGIDSILVTRMNAELERDFDGLPKTLFFEHQTLRSAAGYLAAHFGSKFAVRSDVTVLPTSNSAPVSVKTEMHNSGGIAIIGIAGRYPGAEGLAAFWDNLCADRDLITEIPADRWDQAEWFDARPGTSGRSYSKWGGFLNGVDQFDPLFFNIAPSEAAGIDPNERLFLETCWEALEDAGHTRASLARDPARLVGVYAGVMYGEYQILAAARASADATVGGASPYWSIANRVSYHLDLHGPSIAIDSACSSSSTAIHLACQAVATGECSVAIAGGVNLSLHPLKYVGLSQGRFAASDGRCHSFTAGGDGYVPGEGVGAVVLKPLTAAIADGDYIHAVIRGWAANHGGKTNGYTVPNPKLQGEVIAAALRRADVPASSISYVEAHGTGTALGDPIEVAGLVAAFDGVAVQSCALGSVKANIGHLEAAAGIVALTRVVLQLEHRMLTPTHRHGPANPNIDFAATPFRLQERTEAWTATTPLRAGISSFGAGGSNTHLVVEEFRTIRVASSAAGPSLFVLSARTEAQLRAYAARMVTFLRVTSFSLADVCRTLQLGREPMAVRLAFVAKTHEATAVALEAFLSGSPGAVSCNTPDDDTAGPAVPTDADFSAVGRAWTAGALIDWDCVAHPGERVPLPAHPFMRRRYWLDTQTKAQVAHSALHRFLDYARPSMEGAVLVKRFDPAEPVVRDHRVQGRLLVPAVVQLEMARAAAALSGLTNIVLSDVVWSAPLVVEPDGTEVTVTLRRAEEVIGFEIALADASITSRGRLVSMSDDTLAKADIGGLRAKATRHFGATAIYNRLTALGLEYGPTLRSLTDLWISDAGLLAALVPKIGVEDVTLPPDILDAALQSLLGFASDDADRLFVPFALAEARIFGDLAQARFVVATRQQTADGVALFDLMVCAEDGAALLRLGGLAARPNGAKLVAPRPVMPLAIRQPVWRVAPNLSDIADDTRVLLVRGGEDLGLQQAFGDRVQSWRINSDAAAIAAAADMATDIVWVARAMPGGDMAEQASTMALDLLHAVQALERSGRLGRELRLRIVTRDLQSVSLRERPDPRAGAVLGLAKSIALEYPRVAVTLADFDAMTLAHPDLPRFVLAEPATVPVCDIVWRNGARYRQVMQPITLGEAVPPLQPGAVVLIVGGAGGIGTEMAGWLARSCAARVALVGRRPSSDVSARLAALTCGIGEVRYFQADATDPRAMAEVVTELRALWGGVDAAIHAALILRDRTLSRMDDETFRVVLAPKLAGSVVLADALAGEQLQFFAFLSSVNVISGSRGQANYVAGSSFADAFARHLAAERPWRVVVTNWGLWGDVGVVSDETYRLRLAQQGVYPIRPEEGIAAFAAILAGTIDRVAIARAEPQALRQLGLDSVDAETPIDLAAAEAAFATLERYGRVTLRGTLDVMLTGVGTKVWTLEGLRRRLGVAKQHTTLFAALMDALARDRLVDATDGLWRMGAEAPVALAAAREALDTAERDAPWLAGPRRLLQLCLDVYPALLRGEVNPVTILFPKASMAMVETTYAGNPVADHFNRLAGAAVAAAVVAGKSEILRVIELGAGTGSTTAAVLEALAGLPGRIDYLATDVSQRFLSHGQARFADRPYIRFGLYDVEREVEQNGVAVGSFDVVLAANVLHATADLSGTLARIRRLLRPGGQLLLSEATRRQDFGTLVFGLTPGWWLATDRARRIPYSPLVTVDGWQALLTDAGFAATRALTASAADGSSPHALLFAENRERFATVALPIAVVPRAVLPSPAPSMKGGATVRLQDHLRTLLSDVLKIAPDEIRLNESFDRFGLESLTALEIRNRLDQDISGLPATLLFEHNTLALLAAWLAETHPEQVARRFADVVPVLVLPEITPTILREAVIDEPIAIIGFSGRYPGAPDADALWRLLHAGESAITEVPADRWNAAESFDAAGGEGRSYTKWGGFIDAVDRFDPLFFNISPLEAEVMDPQERLFLETAWATLEQAGYSPDRLRDRASAACPEGSDVGVFVGAMNVPYQWVAAEAVAAGHANAASTSYWSIANRVSFLLDFSGPSMVVDTACSASLTAIHLACESLRRGECGAALAGGVNLILHPRQFVHLSQARMVSHGAECRSFGAGADGFVDGEGVGAVLLKRLSAAERDGDRIEGVILGTAVNSGGRTSGFSVPSPKAQARVIRAALRRAGATADSISYVEAHGTGTVLGDPIEIGGLAEVFADTGRERIPIGALKANIGHLESAAGIAGLTKVLLQLRHRTILPSRHAAEPNPLIDLSRTPFMLPMAPIAWQPAQAGGRLRAGLSSFGAGGANAHLVIEDYTVVARAAAGVAGPELVLLSARDLGRLRVKAEALLLAIRDNAMPLPDLSHTLRVGRQPMAARLAVIVQTGAELEAKLAGWLAGNTTPNVTSGLANGAATRRLSETTEGLATLSKLLANGDIRRLAPLWVEGAEIDWSQLPTAEGLRLIELPSYPFARERYWLPLTPAVKAPVAVVPLAAEPMVSEPVLAEGPVRMQLFARIWQPAPAVGRRAVQPVFVLARDGDLAARLGAVWGDVVLSIRPGPGFAVIDTSTLRMDPLSEADHAALLGHLGRTSPTGFTIVQALDWQDAAGSKAGDAAMVSILLTQAAQRSMIANVRILHLFARADERPLDQAVGSLARSAMQESDDCRLRAVGIAGSADATAAAAICRDELLAEDEAPEVFHSEGLRQIPAIEPVQTDPSAATIGFRIGGAYLLVGGLGEVGCALAERLGRDYRARIAIIGRSDPRGPALERLNRLRESGLQIHYEACDLTDPDGLNRALVAIRTQLGRLHGVLHLARTVEDALLVRKSATSVARVMAAKVEGSIALDAALAGEELDWFVLCSSLAAWLGLAGGGDYALACAFQNGFARLRQLKVERGERSGRTVAICWPQWQHDRYLNDSKRSRLAAEGVQMIDARDGLRIIAQALQSDHTEVAAVKGNEQALHRLTLAYGQPPRHIAEELSGLSDAALAAYIAYLDGPALSPEKPQVAAPRETLEHTVVDIICSFLKLPPERFTPDSEFAEFGLDSIKALHVAERLQKRLGIPIDPAMFYENPKIGVFVQALVGRSADRLARAQQ